MLQNQELSSMIADDDQKVTEITNNYHTADPSPEIGLVLTKMMAVKTLGETEQAKEARYRAPIRASWQTAESLAKLKKVEETIAVNPNIDTIKTELRQLAALLAAASIEYTPDHPEYKHTSEEAQYCK